jgi:hypothetical protein
MTVTRAGFWTNWARTRDLRRDRPEVDGAVKIIDEIVERITE